MGRKGRVCASRGLVSGHGFLRRPKAPAAASVVIGNPGAHSHNDPQLWRPASSVRRLGGTTSLHNASPQSAQDIADGGERTTDVWTSYDTVGALDVAIVLHERECCQGVGRPDDGSSALTMMPPHIEFIEHDAPLENVL